LPFHRFSLLAAPPPFREDRSVRKSSPSGITDLSTSFLRAPRNSPTICYRSLSRSTLNGRARELSRLPLNCFAPLRSGELQSVHLARIIIGPAKIETDNDEVSRGRGGRGIFFFSLSSFSSSSCPAAIANCVVTWRAPQIDFGRVNRSYRRLA